MHPISTSILINYPRFELMENCINWDCRKTDLGRISAPLRRVIVEKFKINSHMLQNFHHNIRWKHGIAFFKKLLSDKPKLEDSPVISHSELENILEVILRDDQRDKFNPEHQIDTSMEIEELGTVRIYFYRQRGKLAMANRIIGSKIPDFESLGLPPVVQKLAHQQRGLILVCGATSNGKSTTLAALIEKINQTYSRHILTIEDPIEFVFENKKSIISQRDIGIDTTSFSASIVGAMRQDPDVILISDLRDNETIENALTASETGYLVFATTHAPTTRFYNTLIVYLPGRKTGCNSGKVGTEPSRSCRSKTSSQSRWSR